MLNLFARLRKKGIITKICNRTKDKPKRKMLRNTMPEAEIILWSKIRNKQLGCRFRRQYGIWTFVVDFYCPDIKLAIEIDGENHFRKEAQERDNERQRIIEGYGIRFLRFTNNDVRRNLNGVLLSIEETLKTITGDSSQQKL